MPLACLLPLFSIPGHGVLGVKAQDQVFKDQQPDSLRGQGPGASAKNKLGSILDCFMVGGPGLLAPGPRLPLLQGMASPTGQLWPGSHGYEVGGGEGGAEANFPVMGPVYLPEGWKPRWEPPPHH